MSKKLFTEEQELEICTAYTRGISGYSIANSYNTNQTTIQNVLKRYNIKPRQRSDCHIYNIDYNKFNVIDDEYK